MRLFLNALSLCTLAVLSAACSSPLVQSGPPSGPLPGAAAQKPGAAESGPGAYGKVIPATAVTDSGLFVTHRVEGRLYYEIPREHLGADMLLVTTIARNADGKIGGSPVNNRLIRWERRGDKILLRSPDYGFTADSARPVFAAVQAASHAPILASFPIDAWSPDSAAVIEVTRLFTGDVPEFGPNHPGTLEKDRTFVERVSVYRDNIEVEATHTRTARPDVPGGIPPEFAPPPQSRSIVLHWSMVKLPDRPMKPRRADQRVGYFTTYKTDFGSDSHRVEKYRLINRWRLECAAGELTPCEPVRPIVYYIDPATPERWVPWIKRGVEAWRRAFEKAGFRNAIVAREAPTSEEDPDWSAEDASHSVIRWMASDYENAMGPSVTDPRTGEILEADIQMYHNVMKLVGDWYFVQVAPLDPRVHALPMPDSLMGRLIAYIVSHEVGHTLGLQHNMKASSTYPADSLRSESFLRRMGHTPSIMDYARFNYLVQPEDGIPLELLIPRIGPYDEFAIMWGYRPVEDDTHGDEAATLDAWARMQDTVPWYRFHTDRALGADAGQLTEAVGDEDAVQSTRLGLKNIRRTVPLLIPATVRPGENFDALRELYEKLVVQWGTELGHVAAIVGGVDSREKYGGQEGWRFDPIPAERQREAMRFLAEEAFRVPEYLLDREILRRIELQGAIDRIGDQQREILGTLLETWRMERMVEVQALALPGERVYTLGEMLGDVRQGIWNELSSGRVRIDPFRRSLQDSYLDLLAQRLNPNPPQNQSRRRQLSQQVRALLRGELRALDASIAKALPRTADRDTRLHLENARTRITRILDPRG